MDEQAGDADPGSSAGGNSAFDPIATARAFGGVQAQALRAAGDLVERLTQLVDGPQPESSADPLDAAEAPPTESARLVDLWAEILARVSRTFDGTGKPHRGPTDRFELDLAGGLVPGVLEIEWDRTSSTGTAEVWLTNGSDGSLAGLMLTVGPLITTTGVPIEAAVRCDPAVVDELPARSSRGVSIEVSATDDMAPGTYRGLAQVDGAPGAWCAIEVVVDARTER